MWLVKITPSSKAQAIGAEEALITIVGNDSSDLFRERVVAWTAIYKLMDQGLVSRVDIDFVPSRALGVRRIRRINNKFYQTRDHVICSPGFIERQDAWEWESSDG